MRPNAFSWLILAFSGTLLSACGQSQKAPEKLPDGKLSPSFIFSIENSAERDFVDTPLVMSNTQLYRLGIAPTVKAIRMRNGETELASQLDDLDGDGQFDELAFLIDIPAKTKLTITLEASQTIEGLTNQQYERRTNIHLGKFPSASEKSIANSLQSASRRSEGLSKDYSRQYQMEGPAWENDNIGFRLYFDERNGFDIFGKTQSSMILENVGIDQNYHQLQVWGMDILKVGRSLGAGALAVLHDIVGEQILQRVANAEQTHVRIVSEGPVRSILDLQYQGLPLLTEEPTIADLRQRISIWAGQHYYNSELLLSNSAGPVTMAMGLVNLHELNAVNTSIGTKAVLASFGQQAEESTQLGMAVVGEASQHLGFGDVGATKEGVEHSFYSSFTLKPEQALKYHFYAVWQPRMQKINSKKAFIELIETDILREKAVRIRLP